MNCNQCGAATFPGASFCSQCGARLPASAPISAPDASSALASSVSPPVPAPHAQRPLEALAIASVVLGALAWLTLPVIGAAAAVITGHLAKGEIRRSNGRLGGGELATVGLILGYLQLAIAVLAVLVVLGILALGLRASRISV